MVINIEYIFGLNYSESSSNHPNTQHIVCTNNFICKCNEGVCISILYLTDCHRLPSLFQPPLACLSFFSMMQVERERERKWRRWWGKRSSSLSVAEPLLKYKQSYFVAKNRRNNKQLLSKSIAIVTTNIQQLIGVIKIRALTTLSNQSSWWSNEYISL